MGGGIILPIVAAVAPKAEAFLGVSGLTPGAAGIMALLLPILGGVVIALIKAWPTLSLQAINARAALRAEKRTDLDDCRERLDGFGARLDAAEARFHSAEIQVVTIVSAYSIVDAELERTAPASVTLAQARRMLRAAFPTAADIPPHMVELLHPFTVPPATRGVS